MKSKLETLCENVIAAREARDALNRQLVACRSDLALAEASLSAALQASGSTYAYAGFRFTASTQVCWKMLKESKARLVQIIKGGAPELVKESVHSSSLRSYLRKHEASLEEERPRWWTEAKAFLERTERPGLSVRKANTNTS